MATEARRSEGLFRDLGLLALLSATLFLPWLGARDLWNPNEPLYGRAVVEMREAGDWSTPRVNGEVFPEKPILYYWMALAASAGLGGAGEFALRLPSALSGIAGVLLVYLLVRTHARRRQAWCAAAVYATTYIVFWSSRQVQMDLLLATCTLGAIVPSVLAIDRRWSPGLAWPVAGAAVGLGFLAKGPVGLICPALVVGAYVAASGNWPELRRPALLLGAAAFLLVASPWFVFLLATGEREFLAELLWRQNVQRFVDPWDHQAPWWYYLKVFWLDMLPWSLFLPLAWALPARDEAEARLHRLAWLWLVVVIVFFSLSASKRSPYILPVAPAMAILVSALLERAWSNGLEGPRLIGVRGLLATYGLGIAVAAVYLRRAAPGYHPQDAVLQAGARSIVLLLVAWFVLLLIGLVFLNRSPAVALSAFLAGVVALYLVASATVLPATNRYKSPRRVGEAIRTLVPAGAPLRGFHGWKWRASYSYYAGRPIPTLGTVDELREYWSRPGARYVVVEQGLLDEARAVLGTREPLASHRVGNNAAHLFGR